MICEPLPRQTIQFAQEKYKHLSELILANNCSGDEDSHIDILTGADNYHKIATGRIIRGETNEPIAMSTRLGYVLIGELPGAPKPTLSNANQVNLVSATHVLQIDTSGSDTVTLHRENFKLDEQVKRFYDFTVLFFGINEREGVYHRFVKGIS